MLLELSKRCVIPLDLSSRQLVRVRSLESGCADILNLWQRRRKGGERAPGQIIRASSIKSARRHEQSKAGAITWKERPYRLCFAFAALETDIDSIAAGCVESSRNSVRFVPFVTVLRRPPMHHAAEQLPGPLNEERVNPLWRHTPGHSLLRRGSDLRSARDQRTFHHDLTTRAASFPDVPVFPFRRRFLFIFIGVSKENASGRDCLSSV